MREWLKRNWKILLIIVFSLFGLTKCTQSCNRKAEITQLNNKINNMDSTISVKDSTIYDLQFKVFNLESLLESEKTHNNDFANIATKNQKDINVKLNALRIENANLKNLVKELTKENTELKNKIEK